MRVSLGDKKVLEDKDMTIWLKLINVWSGKYMWENQNSWKFEQNKREREREREREKELVLVRVRERKSFNWFKSHIFH